MAVGVIGLGYVGLPLTMAFAEAGERVVGVDLDPGKAAATNADESYVEDIPSERLQAALPMIQATPQLMARVAMAPFRAAERLASALASDFRFPTARTHSLRPSSCHAMPAES
jgi:nucleoside-diphosphate-sugar epimerase